MYVILNYKFRLLLKYIFYQKQWQIIAFIISPVKTKHVCFEKNKIELLETNLDITQVSQTLGYSSEQLFASRWQDNSQIGIKIPQVLAMACKKKNLNFLQNGV